MLLVTATTHAREGESVDVQEKEQGAVESFFYDVWSTVKSMSPSRERGAGSEDVTVTAGLRGAEGDEQALAPYWKGGLSDDPQFRQEIQAYQTALQQGRGGDPGSLAQFLDQHGDSALAPNAQFALGVAHAQVGNGQQARRILESFRQDYPGHPLSDKAKAVMARVGA
jgi:hypothetical protein